MKMLAVRHTLYPLSVARRARKYVYLIIDLAEAS